MGHISDILEIKGRVVHCIDPDATVFAAVQQMVASNSGSLLVQKTEQVVGIITERDYLRQIVLKNRSSKTTAVREIMSTKLVVVHPDTTIDQAMAIMTEKHIRHLPVIVDGKVCGVVSIGDLVKHQAREQEAHITYLTDYISDRYPR